jgi:hypothetical protein
MTAVFEQYQLPAGIKGGFMSRLLHFTINLKLLLISTIKILKVNGKRAIYLNQGGKMTEVGQQYEVYSQAEKIPDPDTGLMITIDGDSIATIQIIKVRAKYSTAKLLRGRFKEIKKGAIVRLKKTKPRHKKQPKVMELDW